MERRRERASAALHEARQQLRAGSFDAAIRQLENARGLDPSLSTEIEAELVTTRETAAERVRAAREAAMGKAKRPDTTEAAARAREPQEHNDGRTMIVIDTGDRVHSERPTSQSVGPLKRGVGGLAAGAIIGGAVAQPRYYAPAPVYEVEPAYAAPRCYMTRGEPVWDAYRGIWVRPRVRVCD